MKIKTILANDYAKTVSKNDTYKKFLAAAFEEGWKQSAQYIANLPVFETGAACVDDNVSPFDLLPAIQKEILEVIDDEL